MVSKTGSCPIWVVHLISPLKNALTKLISEDEPIASRPLSILNQSGRKKTTAPKSRSKSTSQPAKSSQKEGRDGLCWARTPSPAAFVEQSLEILPSSSHERLTVDAPQEPQAEASHAMPLFALGK